MAEDGSKYPPFAAVKSPNHRPWLAVLLSRCQHVHAVCVANHGPVGLVHEMNPARQAQRERIIFRRRELKVEFAVAVFAPLGLK